MTYDVYETERSRIVVRSNFDELSPERVAELQQRFAEIWVDGFLRMLEKEEAEKIKP